jgi:hypothetical protein
MSDEVVENKRSRVEDTCTVHAWIDTLTKLYEINPSAILSTTEHVLSTERINQEIWSKRSNNRYDQNDRRRFTQKEVANGCFFNVLLVAKDSEKQTITETLESQDKELGNNQFESLDELLNSIKDLEPSDQLNRVRRNTRFRDTLYFFPDTHEWVTLKDITSMCGGKVYYNFDELFETDREANFIHVCRLPYELVSKTVLRDPVRDLLKKYESSLNQ